MKNREIKVVAFDADDTLWDCQTWFDKVEQECCELLKPWATAREVSEGLFATERKNLSLTGYGTKAFTLSLIENAVRVSHEQLTGDIVMRLIELGQQLLRFPTTPLPEVEETLRKLAERRQYRLVVFTKGERNSFRSDIAPALAAGAWTAHIPYHVVWELEKSEEFPHERLQKITHFSELLEILC